MGYIHVGYDKRQVGQPLGCGLLSAVPLVEHSRFYMELKEDIGKYGYDVPLKTKLYLLLPSLWMRRMYSKLSDLKISGFRLEEMLSLLGEAII